MAQLIIKDPKILAIYNQVVCDDVKEKQIRLSNSGIESHNSCETCAVCLECPSLDDATNMVQPFIKHHVTYFPQKIAYVHDKCHKKIHETKNHFLIQYDVGDSQIFYDNQKALSKTNQRSIYQ